MVLGSFLGRWSKVDTLFLSFFYRERFFCKVSITTTGIVTFYFTIIAMSITMSIAMAMVLAMVMAITTITPLPTPSNSPSRIPSPNSPPQATLPLLE